MFLANYSTKQYSEYRTITSAHKSKKEGLTGFAELHNVYSNWKRCTK